MNTCVVRLIYTTFSVQDENIGLAHEHEGCATVLHAHCFSNRETRLETSSHAMAYDSTFLVREISSLGHCHWHCVK